MQSNRAVTHIYASLGYSVLLQRGYSAMLLSQDALEGPRFERNPSARASQQFRKCQMHSIILCFQDPGTLLFRPL